MQETRAIIESCQQDKQCSGFPFGRLTDVTGYRWTTNDLEIIGSTGGTRTPLSLDLVVEALRHGHHSWMMVSLEPSRKGKRHFVLAIPTSLYDTQLLERMVAADYVTKVQVLGGGHSSIPGVPSVIDRLAKDIDACERPEPVDFDANMFFVQRAPAELVYATENNGYGAYLANLDVNLVTGPAVKNAHALAFAQEYTTNLDQISRDFSAIGDLITTFRLFRVAQAVRADIEIDETGRRAEILRFWLTQYAKEAHRIKIDLPGLDPISLGRICVVNLQESVRALTVRGGVIIGSGPGRITEAGFEIDSTLFQEYAHTFQLQERLNQISAFWDDLQRRLLRGGR